MTIIYKTAAVLVLVSAIASCTDDESFHERIKVNTKDGEAISKTLFIPVEGESSHLEVQADESLEIFCKSEVGETDNWFRITDVRKLESGKYIVEYEADARRSTLDLRNVTMSLVAPSAGLGCFLNVRQGFRKVWNESFSSGDIALAEGQSWTSATIDGISSVKDAWITFIARGESASGDNNCPLMITLAGGGIFTDNDKAVCEIDVASSDEYGSDSFRKLHIYNGGKVFSSESKVIFSVPDGSSASVRIDEVCVYEIPVKSSGITGISDYDE